MGPPSGPPVGPPPSGPPEFLDSGRSSGPVPSSPADGARRPAGRRRAVIAGGAIAGIAAVGTGGYFAWSAYLATGPQPAEALPASTVAYVSVDLDPSGKQKLAALDALEKFPAFEENVDVDRDDDLRQSLVELVQREEGVCPDIDYADDIEPWLGDRFAMAAVDLGDGGGDVDPDDVTPVGVLQVTDADAAEEGLEKLLGCLAEGGDDLGGWAVQGDWVVLAETDELAQEVTDAATDAPLSDDDDFQRWTDAAGDEGILTAYAAPAAGPLLAEAVGSFGGLAAAVPSCPAPAPGASVDPGTDVDPVVPPCGDVEVPEPDAAASALREQLEDFQGMALKVRFDDGGLEVEAATGAAVSGLDTLPASERGGDVVATLPDDTAMALGLGFEEGWFDSFVGGMAAGSGGLLDVDELIATIEQETGLQLPEDAEALLGESAALAVGGDIDLTEVAGMPDPTGLPVGIKVRGDTDRIESLLEQLDAAAAGVEHRGDGDHVAAGFSADYVDSLLGDGDLGDTDAYRDVIPESDDAAAVLFVNFDAGSWLDRLAEGDDEVAANVEPLSAAGLSAWVDDDVAHSLLRITVD
ncbi:DUF3352 domain-containing protein [Nocardioides dongxiaopingii]|nr:DUF3352 domain-containing protein [Nocardioides sp. S-1144]